jgi:hypothetical protein
MPAKPTRSQVRTGLRLFVGRSRQDAREVVVEVRQSLASGAMSFRELSRNSHYWQSQAACALARLLFLGEVVKVDEGRYRRIR